VAHGGAEVAVGVAAIADREAAVLQPRDRGEERRTLAPVVQLQPGQVAAADAVLLLRGVERDNPVGVLVGKRLDEHAVGDAEHHRVHADPDRETGHRQARNPFVFQRGTQTKANVLDEHDTG